jgi:pimeloyl-ACP methyl ester carboxylesterase
MNGYSATYSKTRYTPNEGSVLFLPRHPTVTKRAILYAHGANGDALQLQDFNSLRTLTKCAGQIALDNFVILAIDAGGAQTWGNNTELTAMEAAWAWLQASGLCASDKVILAGASMGSLSAHRFAAEHAASVAAMMLWMPALDIEDIRNRNALSSRDLINTAWGLAAGSTLATGGAQVPTAGRPLDRVAAYDGVKTRIEYSSGDTVCTAAACDTYAGLRTGANLTRHVSGSGDHGEPALSGMDIAACLGFLDSVA